ncbi:MAG: hypothetical protein KJ600_01230 [Nanoarchaeota archaeon]|nr:hypothetical protein [Nanoarchaeota archaeon]
MSQNSYSKIKMKKVIISKRKFKFVITVILSFVILIAISSLLDLSNPSSDPTWTWYRA